ncbi:hypothetical protein Tco_0864261, partial [Tanacetum coccineum]
AATPWAAYGGRRKRVKCYVQGSGRRKRKKVIGRSSGRRARTRYSGANLSLLLLYILKELAHAKSNALSRYTTEHAREDFFKARITEARFEIIAKEDKEHIVEKKIDVILPLHGEFASPKAKGSLNADEYIGVEEVVGGGEALRIGEDDDLGNAATDGGDDAVESGDISILNSLIGHGSPRSFQLWEKSARGMFMCSSTMATRIILFDPTPKRNPGFAQEGGFVYAYDEGNVETTTATTNSNEC